MIATQFFEKKKLIVHIVLLNVGRDLDLIHNYLNEIEITITKGLFLIFWVLYNFITQLNQKFSTIFSISEYGITKSMKTCYICGFSNAIFGDIFRWYKCRLVSIFFLGGEFDGPQIPIHKMACESNPWAWWPPRILLCTLEFFSRNSCTANHTEFCTVQKHNLLCQNFG